MKFLAEPLESLMDITYYRYYCVHYEQLLCICYTCLPKTDCTGYFYIESKINMICHWKFLIPCDFFSVAYFWLLTATWMHIGMIHSTGLWLCKLLQSLKWVSHLDLQKISYLHWLGFVAKRGIALLRANCLNVELLCVQRWMHTYEGYRCNLSTKVSPCSTSHGA